MKNQKMNKSKLSLLSGIAAVGILLLAACSPAATPAPTETTVAMTETPAVMMTETPAVMMTETPAAAMTDTPAAVMTETPAAAMTETPDAGAATATPDSSMSTTETPAAGSTPGVMTTTMVNVSTTNATLGKFLVDSNSMTLYTYKSDTADTSACMAACIANWPPLVADNGTAPKAGTGLTGALGVITRSDGIKQVTYNHMPLYYFKSDTKPGDTTGQGVGGLWTVAVP